MPYRVTLTRDDGRTVRPDFHIYDKRTPKVNDTINVMCDKRIVKAQVTRIRRLPPVDQVEAKEL